MAEDKTDSSLSSETPTKTESEGYSSRRNSTGKQNSRDTGQRAVPHYLRASTGSCHDFCKYGRKHDFEPKPRLPLSRRIKKPQNQKLDSSGDTAGEEGTNVKPRLPDPARDSEVHFPAPPEIIKEVVFLQPKEVESSPPSQDSSSDKTMPNVEKKIKNSSTKSYPPPTQRPQAKAKASKRSSLSKTSEGVKPNARRNSDIIGSERTETGKKAMASRETSKSSTSKELNSRKRTDRNRTREADVETEEKVFEKTLHVIETEGKDDLVEPARDGDTIANAEENNIKDKGEAAQDGEIIVSFSPPSSSLPESSSSHVKSNPTKSKIKTLTKAAKRVVSKLDTPSPVKLKFRRGKVVDIRHENNGPRRLIFRKARLLGKNQDNKTESKDKKLVEFDHVISLSPPSRENGNEERSGLANSKGDGKKIASSGKGGAPGRNQNNKTSKKDNLNLVVTKLDNPLPVKLKFKRGTVVNLQHNINTTTPRRLGFRKARHSMENQDSSRSDAGKKKSSKKRAEGGENSTGLNPAGKVVLRHQDVQQGKKDAQGLFNNVIEETASKLVESKKSKVKALVGAFETVISLQEKKPSSAHAVS